jgi:hypothetical protein
MIGMFVFVFMPPLIVDGDDFTAASSRVKAENDVRTTGIQALAGLALVVGAVFTAITLVYNREQQITERYTQAIDQLDHSRALDIRVGGIYALERIMRDSKRDHGAILDLHPERTPSGTRIAHGIRARAQIRRAIPTQTSRRR